jgi:hypothetical protein
MADLNIRNIEPEMIARLKREALELKQTLRERCIDLLNGNLECYIPKSAADSSANISKESYLKYPQRFSTPKPGCPTCGGLNGMHQKGCKR